MKALFLSFMIAGAALTAQADLIDQAILHNVIVNGTLVPAKETSVRDVTAKLIINNPEDPSQIETFCTGTLIAQDIILTAAHCLDSGESLAIDVKFDDVTVAAKTYRMHPGYTPLAFQKVPGKNGKREEQIQVGGFNDIALIQLATPMSHKTPASMPQAGARLKNNTQVVIAGYGKTSIDYESDGELRWAKAEASEYSRSRLALNGSSTTCAGDSGGPAYLVRGNQYMVIGVTSTGNCTWRSTHTRVADFIEWIESEVATLRMTIKI